LEFLGESSKSEVCFHVSGSLALEEALEIQKNEAADFFHGGTIAFGGLSLGEIDFGGEKKHLFIGDAGGGKGRGTKGFEGVGGNIETDFFQALGTGAVSEGLINALALVLGFENAGDGLIAEIAGLRIGKEEGGLVTPQPNRGPKVGSKADADLAAGEPLVESDGHCVRPSPGNQVTGVGLGAAAVLVEVLHNEAGKPQEPLLGALLIGPVFEDMQGFEPGARGELKGTSHVSLRRGRLRLGQGVLRLRFRSTN